MDERTAKRKAVRALKAMAEAAREYAEAEQILAQAERQRGAASSGTRIPPMPEEVRDGRQ
jgi:hypothetical protein